MSRTAVRKKKKNKKILFTIIVVILIVVLAFVLIKVLGNGHSDDPVVDPINPDPAVDPVPVEPEPEINIVLSGKNLGLDVEPVIREFFETYYTALAKLEKADMTTMYLDPNSLQAKLCQTAVDYLVECRSLQPTDLHLDAARAELYVNKVTQENGVYKVTIVEDSFLKFKELGGKETEIYGIENTFTLKPLESGEYKISSYNKVQDFFIMFKEYYDKSSSKLDELYSKYIGLIKTNVENRKKALDDYLLGNIPEETDCEYSYDRLEAQKYALTYVNSRNSKYMSLDGNNCQNFVSQVLRAGGIPDDHESSGDYTVWYYNSSSDFTTVWTYVPYFRTYAKTNKGAGLCAEVDHNIYDANIGDVIEVGITGPTRHTTVVADTVEKDGKPVDALLSSNTLDMRNFPITAYVYPYVSLVKIYGYN